MIISHKYKFIFIKTMKTAGTSMEIALSKFCEPEDIVTPILAEDERSRTELGYQCPVNCYAPITDYRIRALAKFLKKGKKKLKFYNHIQASEVRLLVGEDVWSSYYKFCFERNPWDKVISHYYWMCHLRRISPSLQEFLESSYYLDLLRKTGYYAYTQNNEVIVDRVYRFENLAGEMPGLADRLGLPEIPVLPRTKAKIRKDKRHYREIFSDEQKEYVANYFAKEIQNFGYSY